MERLFFQDYRLAESLSVDAKPTKKFTRCPYCNKTLSTANDQYAVNDHNQWFEYGLCLRCGWWDVVYREDDMMGNQEEDSYYHAVLRKFGEIDPNDLLLTELIDELQVSPDKLYSISPRQLEVLLGSLIKNVINCSIELTKYSKDGGKDLIGFDSERGKFIVEIKRYRKSRKINVALVRQLLGVMCLDEIRYGMIVTTSSFTKDAMLIRQELESKGNWLVEYKDFNDIKNWLQLSHKQSFSIDRLNSIMSKIVYAGVYYNFPTEFTTPTGKIISILTPIPEE